MLKRRYSLFSGPSSPNTTQEATVSVPPVWLMSKHSMRFGVPSRSKASRRSSRLDSMPARARARMVSACSALLCIISSQRARMPRTEAVMRTL